MKVFFPLRGVQGARVPAPCHSPCCSGLDENMFTLRAEARANSLRVNARGSGRPGNTAHSCVQPNADYYAVVVKLFSRLAQRCK